MEEGDEVILSVMEHHSNIVPWQLLAARKAVSYTHLHRDLIYKVKAAMVITTVRADKEIITEEITTRIRMASRRRLSNRK